MDGHETPDGFKGVGGQVSLLALLTAKGDLLTHDGTGLATLSVGAAAQVLTVDPLAPLGIKWAAPAAGGGTLAVTYNLGAVAADQTMTVTTAHGGGITVLGHATATANIAFLIDGQTYTDAAGTRKHFALAGSFAPVAGNSDYHHADVAYTINQTGGANGAVTGIHLRATETAVVGAHNLIDLGVGAASRFVVNRSGATSITSSIASYITGLNLSAATNGAPADSYYPINFTVPATGLIGQFLATCNNYASGGGVNLAANSIALAGYATAGQLALFAGGASGYITFNTGGLPAANERMRIDPIGNVTINGASAVATSVLGILATRTLAAPGAGSVWDGICLQPSTLTVTMGAPPVTITALKAVNFYGPTILTSTGAGPLTVTDAYNVYIDAAPVAGAGTGVTTLTRSWSLGVVGRASFADGGAGSPSIAFGLDPFCGFYHNGAGAGAHIGIAVTGLQSGYFYQNGLFVGDGWTAGGGGTIAVFAGGLGSLFVRGDASTGDGTIDSTNAIGGNIFIKSRSITALEIWHSNNIPSAAGAVYRGILFSARTATITGATAITTATGFNANVFMAPTYISDTPTCAITSAATVYISNAPIAGLNVTIANPYALWVASGNTRFDGGLIVHGTNVAGSPYAVLSTDYYLECRTLTGGGLAITVNLPALAGVNNGRIILVGDSDYNAGVSNITIHPNGANKINNINANYVIAVSGTVVQLKANTTTGNWEIC